MPRAKAKVVPPSLAKVPTGIQGLDEVTGGGLPKGRVTLVCGSAGCGKSLLAMEFLVHGAVRYGETLHWQSDLVKGGLIPHGPLSRSSLRDRQRRGPGGP